MTTHQQCSPYLTLPLRSLQEAERAQGIVRGLDDGNRCDIMNGAQEFVACMSCTEGAPADPRYHLRTFFRLLRDRLKTQSVSVALQGIDYEDIPSERDVWEAEAERERRHLLTEMRMFNWRKL